MGVFGDTWDLQMILTEAYISSPINTTYVYNGRTWEFHEFDTAHEMMNRAWKLNQFYRSRWNLAHRASSSNEVETSESCGDKNCMLQPSFSTLHPHSLNDD